MVTSKDFIPLKEYKGPPTIFAELIPYRNSQIWIWIPEGCTRCGHAFLYYAVIYDRRKHYYKIGAFTDLEWFTHKNQFYDFEDCIKAIADIHSRIGIPVLNKQKGTDENC
jgi:hypothetical protein